MIGPLPCVPWDGDFLINDEVFALIKCSTKILPWRFTFTPAEFSAIDDRRASHNTVLALEVFLILEPPPMAKRRPVIRPDSGAVPTTRPRVRHTVFGS
jgi:hypothetical protein